VIDLHAHVLPGIDDGPTSMAAALDLLLELITDGVEVVAATPHVRDDFPTTPRQIAVALDVLRRAAEREHLEIEVLPGAELALDRVRFAIHDGSLAAFSLAGNPRYLLVEIPYYGWPLDLVDVVTALVRSGVCPVLAHPERNPSVQGDVDLVAQLVDGGALVQVTASSLAGLSGKRARRTALTLVDRELVHLVASDSHGAGIRRAGLSVVGDTIADQALVDWLTSSVPAAIVHDRALPERPPGRAPRGRWLSGFVARSTRFRESR